MAFKPTRTIKPEEVQAQLQSGESLYMLDVREPNEWAAGHVAGAMHIPVGQLTERRQELDPNREMIVICRSGNRSGLACELLEEMGFQVVNMTGGLNAWSGELV